MTTFEEDIANKRDDDEIQLPWPEIPRKVIEKWFGLKPDQKIYYYLFKIFGIKVIYMMVNEYPGKTVIVKPWPVVPVTDMENWLGIKVNVLVGYVPSGMDTVSCVTIYPAEDRQEVFK